MTVRGARDEAMARPAPLLQLGRLVAGKVLARPSKNIRTPYVADVALGNGQEVLAHTPMLACAGMVVPDAHVLMTESGPSKTRKTSHVVQLVTDRRFDPPVTVGAHPALGEQLARICLERKLVQELGSEYQVRAQQTFGQSRVDFVLEHQDGRRTLVEVKNVVCADNEKLAELAANGGDPDAAKSAFYDRIAVVKSDGQVVRSAIFPDGKANPKTRVVSERAIKHVQELTRLHADKAQADVDAAVLFLVNRSDTTCFRPCHESCPVFAHVLAQAAAVGVKVLAYNVVWQGPDAYLGCSLPVHLPATAEEDLELVEAVLTGQSPPPRRHKNRRALGLSAARTPATAVSAAEVLPTTAVPTTETITLAHGARGAGEQPADKDDQAAGQARDGRPKPSSATPKRKAAGSALAPRRKSGRWAGRLR
mmetsp:Transcript_20297/g.64816  ORF Transcript_20297/g.64816 Transcript_20297/m.64816 type:complete len:422 (+) Transcript_20297:1223-2488(+)